MFLNRYIYTRKIDVTFSSAECLHWMASKFGVKQLMEDAGRLFAKVLPEDTSFHTPVSLYKYAAQSGDLVLQENCVQYMAWNFQNLTESPAWTHLPVELLKALLARSDLVVPDEYCLLQIVESWITEKGDSISLETQAELLNHIRFPMIPAEKLYELESHSLFSTHKNMYYGNIMKALKFNVLLFSNLLSNPKFNREDDDYQPRIYTNETWSTAIDPSSTQSYYGSYRSLNTPVHNSLIFKDNRITWEVNVFRNQYECSNRGMHCESLPMARLQTYSISQRNILYRNRLLLICQGNYIFQVQDFKNYLAYISVNSTEYSSYPCPDDKYTYLFVVRPEYV